ncbi:hypothetical protein CHELA1G2_13705 [Hyphomicrobiales bacterium]|nr:hypothetical protein CHELA1G2_13705 [Hyphomicrobiales bacterium]
MELVGKWGGPREVPAQVCAYP